MDGSIIFMPEGFLTTGEASRLLHVSGVTLREWAKEGKIEFTRAEGIGTHRRYNVKKFIDSTKQQYVPRPEVPVQQHQRKRVVYARVSTRKQSDNLQRQISMLTERYPSYELVKDIGSGINFKRKGLEKILDYAIKRNLEEVVVAYKDRLCRIGFELFEKLFSKLSDAKIVVLNESNNTPDEELAEDIITVVTVFSATINGRKRYKNRKNNNNESEDIPDDGGKEKT